MYRSKFSQIRPDLLKNAPVADYPLTINLSLLGEVHYIDEYMSVYREGVNGSWKVKNFSDAEKIAKHFIKIEKMLDELNEYTNYQYNEVIDKKKKSNKLHVLFKQRKFKEAKKGDFRKEYLQLGLLNKFVILTDQYAPSLYNFLKDRKRWLSWAMK